MIAAALVLGAVLVAAFVYAAGRVSAAEVCNCPYHCAACAAPEDRNP